MEENEIKAYSKVPAKVSPWSSFKSFVCHEIVLELTPYQQKIFNEVSDFWNQEIYYDKGLRLRPRQKAETQEMPEINVSL